MEFSKREYLSGLSFRSPRDLPCPGIEPRSPALQADSLLLEPLGKLSNTWSIIQSDGFYNSHGGIAFMKVGTCNRAFFYLGSCSKASAFRSLSRWAWVTCPKELYMASKIHKAPVGNFSVRKGKMPPLVFHPERDFTPVADSCILWGFVSYSLACKYFTNVCRVVTTSC